MNQILAQTSSNHSGLGGLSWSSDLPWSAISFVVLVTALLLTGYVLWRRRQSRLALIHRVAELETLSAAGRAIVAADLDVEALCKLIATESAKVIDNSTIQVGLFDGDLYRILFWQINGRLQETPLTFDLTEKEGVVGWSRRSQQPLLVHDFNKERDTLPAQPRYISKNPPRSAIFIPLISSNDVIGIIAAQHQHPNRFNEEDLRRLMILANQAAAAIMRAQEFSRQRERAWTTNAQLQVAEAISRSANLAQVLTAVTRLTNILVGTPISGILLWNAEQSHYYIAKFYVAPPLSSPPIHKTNPIQIGEWHALDAVHIGQALLTTTQIPSWLQPLLPQTSQLTLVPINRESQIMGVLIIEQATLPPNVPSDSQLVLRREELLLNIAKQAALAIERVNLRIAQQEEAWINTALLQVAEAVNSLIDLNEILGTIVRLVPMLVGVESTLILIWDGAKQRFHVGASYGVSEMGRGLLETLAINKEEFATFAPKEMESFSPTASAYSLKLPPWLKKALGTPDADAFLLNARGHLVGVMIVGIKVENGLPPRRGRSNILSTRRLNILNGIAQQSATAVVNNQLYIESAERSRLEQELNVAREIQSSLIPAGNPNIPGCNIASYWQAARQISGDFYDFIPLSNDRWGIVIADVADKGIPAALFMAFSRTIIRTIAFNRISPADCLMRVNQIMDSEAQSDLFVTVFYAVWDAEKQTLTYTNAGHNPPILLQKNKPVQLLSTRGMALGVLPDIKLRQKTVQLQPKDLLILYTDGITEAMNEDYDEFGMDRLTMTLLQTQKQSAESIRDAITTNINAHVGETPQFDDITLVVMKRTPRGTKENQ